MVRSPPYTSLCATAALKVLKSDINFPSESHLLNILVQTPKKQATCPINKQNVFMNTFLDKTRKTTTFLRRCPSFSQF